MEGSIHYFRTGPDRSLRAKVLFGPGTQGPPGHAHGGSMAAVLDEAMGGAAWMWQSDTKRWHDLELVEALPGGSSKAAPPRTAILTQVRGGFEVEGTDSGSLDGLARDGSVYTQALTGRGFAFEVTTGAVAEGEDIDEDLGANGVIPGTSFEADGGIEPTAVGGREAFGSTSSATQQSVAESLSSSQRAAERTIATLTR